MSEWSLIPGDQIRRSALHDAFGGSRQSGISPCQRSHNVLIFTDAASGEQHGYFDSWKDDGCFHYTGEGQRGDQRMQGGNRAILEAEATGRVLRVFQGARGEVTYMGRFTVDQERPWYVADAPETGGGPVRTVIVFRLRPLDSPPSDAVGESVQLTALRVQDVPIEQQYTEKSVVEPARDVYEAERREASLVLRLQAYMEARGCSVSRWKIYPPGEARPIFTDVYVESLKLLIEAKGGVDRCSIRMALGQLLDYNRFTPSGTQMAVLLPEIPREDLMQLLSSARVSLVVPQGKAFVLIDGQGDGGSLLKNWPI